MKVSIITAAYNSEKYIQHCIRSVIEQDYPDIEYIIVDGKSTDTTPDIIQLYEHKISKWVSEPDMGIYDAINKGIRMATGDIVGIMNSDDFFSDKNVISRVVTAFKGNTVSIVYSDIDFIENDDADKIIRHYSSKYFKPWMFGFGFQPAHPTFYTYRNNFDEYGYYRTDLKIAGDFELLVRFVYKNGLSYKYIKDNWVKMRLGGASTSGIKSIIKLNNEILKVCKMNNLYTNILMIYSKYIIKWWGFVFRK